MRLGGSGCCLQIAAAATAIVNRYSLWCSGGRLFRSGFLRTGCASIMLGGSAFIFCGTSFAAGNATLSGTPGTEGS